ncbi:aminoglycoside phosphotransferase family protein [Viridibacillus sp. YIM B01967]|uniref:Aminoglycoside phosphotransferase family protein n=1 Tax=Viridibacillus soli TaxID=2798301 RepID=A0ABS1HC69_9BACL|nr:aminoglycoside phosphotransferase family protein [Viridibacillus soli]MBK3497033.1 aminoglycoside phosphotransferase family protein [Viridibacillus soli]
MNLGNPVAIGNTAKIYLYDNKIVKIFNDYLPDTESSYEAIKQKYAYSCGLSVPKVLDVTKLDGKQAIIMEYIKGRTLGDLLSENMKHAEYYMNISIDIQQKIHMVNADLLEPMSDKLRRQIESAHNLDKRHKSHLIQKLDSMTFENRLCHGDFHLFNLIMSDNKVTIIDWVDSSAGDIRADIYRTYLLYSQFSAELADLYLRLYCEKSGLSECDVFQWAPIIAGARLAENVSSEKTERLMEIINHYCPY